MATFPWAFNSSTIRQMLQTSPNRTVSYTHLDVYKRQIDGNLDNIAQVELRALHSRVCKANLGHRVFHIFHNLFFCINRIVAALAVDVYKRQERTGTRS